MIAIDCSQSPIFFNASKKTRESRRAKRTQSTGGGGGECFALASSSLAALSPHSAIVAKSRKKCRTVNSLDSNGPARP